LDVINAQASFSSMLRQRRSGCGERHGFDDRSKSAVTAMWIFLEYGIEDCSAPPAMPALASLRRWWSILGPPSALVPPPSGLPAKKSCYLTFTADHHSLRCSFPSDFKPGSLTSTVVRSQFFPAKRSWLYEIIMLSPSPPLTVFDVTVALDRR
jgi:hypothetical protein